MMERKITARLCAEIALFAGLVGCASALCAAELPVTQRVDVVTGKSYLIDTPVEIERVSVAAPEIAEAVPVSTKTLVINGRAAGETSLVLWLSDGSRQQYDVNVAMSGTRAAAAREQLEREFEGKVQLSVQNGSAFLTGQVKNLFASARAVSIAEAAGKVINLLNVDVPPQEQQILLKVRFADVDRSKSLELGINFWGIPQGIPFTVTTGTFSATRAQNVATANSNGAVSTAANFSLADALNIFAYDPHLNLGATLKDLQGKNVLQILAEPNVLAMNGHEASFVSGGEFPYPTLQGGGGGVGQVTVSFREFGVRIHFLPTITPRGTIRLHVTPEVSSLDYANALTVSGIAVPGLATRRIDTEIELEDGQTFAIAGLLDQRTTETLARIPGLSDIPLLGNLFKSRSTNKAHSELLVLVTPELVSPIPAGRELPDLERPMKFLNDKGSRSTAPRTPGPEVTGPVTPQPKRSEISIQEMESIQRLQQDRPSSGAGGYNQSAPPPIQLGQPSGVTGTGDPATQGQGTVPAQRPPK